MMRPRIDLISRALAFGVLVRTNSKAYHCHSPYIGGGEKCEFGYFLTHVKVVLMFH
jgi:hypothetical protein